MRPISISWSATTWAREGVDLGLEPGARLLAEFRDRGQSAPVVLQHPFEEEAASRRSRSSTG